VHFFLTAIRTFKFQDMEKPLPILVYKEHEFVVQVKLIKFRFSEQE